MTVGEKSAPGPKAESEVREASAAGVNINRSREESLVRLLAATLEKSAPGPKARGEPSAGAQGGRAAGSSRGDHASTRENGVSRTRLVRADGRSVRLVVAPGVCMLLMYDE